jgi:hypothetical protein
MTCEKDGRRFQENPHYQGSTEGRDRVETSSALSIFIKVNVMYVCIYVCSVNGIDSFPSFTRLYKYEYKQGEMWHSNQRAEISEKICMFPWPLPGNGYMTSIRGNQQ